MRIRLISLLMLFASTLVASAQDAGPDPGALKAQLLEEQARARKIESQRLNLERNVEFRQKRLKSVNKTLQIYEYNLEQAQKVLDGAQQEIEGIQKRNLERLQLFRACSYSIEAQLVRNVADSKVLQVRGQSIQRTAAQIAQDLFAAIKAEEPRLIELQRIVDEKKAYQQRIRTVYLPADLENQEKQEEIILKNEVALQQTQAASVEISSSIRTLKENLQAAQQKIEKLQAAFQRTKALPTPAPTKPETTTQTQTASGTVQSITNRAQGFTPFEARKGQLPWPAEGRLARPFGEYTHPALQVKMNNAGVDIEIPSGTALTAAADGEVMYAGEIPGMGEAVILDHGGDYLTVYGNLHPRVKKNDWVAAGQPLGNVNANNAGQAVYHFELRKGNDPLNPIVWLRRLPNL